MTLSGFWSYVHADDKAEGGRIQALAHDIVAQFEMQTGESVELFLDRDSLEWGAEWEPRIAGATTTVAFFVPVLTPRYFASPACRGELNTFARTASALGTRELLLPILYEDLLGGDQAGSEDELVALANSFQWVDWRELRFANRDDGSYRKAVHELAKRLAAANRAAETPAATAAALAAVTEQEEGHLEVMARFEESLPGIVEVTGEISEQILETGQITQAAADRMKNAPAGTNVFAFRLKTTRELAADLRSPATRIGELAEEFSRTLHDMDRGIRFIISRAPEEPEGKEMFCKFFRDVRGTVAAAETGLGAIASMGDSAAQLEGMSREIRPVIREMRRGLTMIAEGREVMREWTALIDASDVECGTETEIAPSMAEKGSGERGA